MSLNEPKPLLQTRLRGVITSGNCVRAIVRMRYIIFSLVLLVNLAAFNGQWRVGRDSALYRSVAENLASGAGYSFRGEPEHHVYPGLPLLLAGVERVFGEQDAFRPLAAQVVMLGIAGLTLVTVYLLIRRRYPQWIAITVTAVLGLHYRFVQHSQELMTDVPFLLALCAALLGFDYLRTANTRGRWLGALLLMLAGLGMAAVMRPTYWALAMAWIAACAWGLIRSGDRARFAVALGCLVVVSLAWLRFDPRTAAFDPLSAKYESKIAARITSPDVLLNLPWWKMIDELLPEAVFGMEFIPVVNAALALLVVFGGLALFRREPLWGLLIASGVAVCMLNSGVPRYYLMVLPLLLLGWMLLVFRISRWLSNNAVTRGVVVTAGMALVFVPATGKSIGIVLEQQGWTEEGRRPFLTVYDDGYWQSVISMSDMIHREVRPHERVLGHEPRVLSYLSGRAVYGVGDGDDEFPMMARRMKKGQYDYAIFPDTLYRRDDLMRQLMDRHVITPRPEAPVKRIGDQMLCRIRIDTARMATEEPEL